MSILIKLKQLHKESSKIFTSYNLNLMASCSSKEEKSNPLNKWKESIAFYILTSLNLKLSTANFWKG